MKMNKKRNCEQKAEVGGLHITRVIDFFSVENRAFIVALGV
jgi:hypothetical protein